MLQEFWFCLIAVLWAGFLVLEGFDFGVGMLLPLVASTDEDRRIALRSIGPVWDGNEVWLLVAGGATFAAFPEWYASMFSGFYLAFVLLLIGLILRGIGIEYRERAETANGRRWCDTAIVVGSFLPSLLLGVAFADLVRGLRMNAAHQVVGGFFDLLSPYALLGGVVTLTLFAFHGAVFLALRTSGPVAANAGRVAVMDRAGRRRQRGCPAGLDHPGAGRLGELRAGGPGRGQLRHVGRSAVAGPHRSGLRRQRGRLPAGAGLGLRLPLAECPAGPQQLGLVADHPQRKLE